MKSKVLINNENKLSKFKILFIYFCIYSFLGWVLETLYVSNLKGELVKRGFLFGPLCPIYGFGAVMLITIFDKYKNNNGKLFLYSIIVFSVFEYLVGFGLEAMFSNRWWDYSTHFLNLNGRITLFSSLIWGILAILFFNVIHPFIQKKLNSLLAKLSYLSQNFIVNLIFIIYIVDTFMASCFHLVFKINYL